MTIVACKEMKRISHILLCPITPICTLLCLMFVFQSCNSSGTDIQKRLDDAERLMMERPDSSLAILDSINVKRIYSRKDRARYALLYTQARDKNYIDDTDLSLISEAKNYYEHSGNVRDRFMSLLYYGRILCNGNNYPQAMMIYTQAESLVDELDDGYLSGLLFAQIANIHLTYLDYGKATDAFKSAYYYYSLVDKEPHASEILLYIGIAYWNNQETALGEEYIIKALNSAISQENNYLVGGCYENLIILYDAIDEVEKCGAIIDKLNHLQYPDSTTSVCLASVASYNSKINKIDQMKSCLESAWKSAQNEDDSVSLFFRSAKIMKRIGEADKALHYYEEGIMLQNKSLRIALQQPILSVQKDYYQNQAEYHSYRLKKNRQVYIALAVGVLLLLLIVAMHVRHRFLLKELEISKYLDLASDLQSSIHDKDTKLSEMSQRVSAEEEAHSLRINEMSGQIAELFQKQHELLNKLSNTYYETQGYSKDKEMIYEQVKSEINKFANDDKSMIELENIVNTYKNNVMYLIRNEIPNVSERDLKLLCYIYAGFSAKSISIFTEDSTGNIFTRKYRLRNKISRLHTPNMDIILQEMP